MIESGRTSSAHPLLAERCVSKCVAEGRQALVEDLLAVRNKQKSRAVERLAESGVVDGCHHGFPRSRGGDQEVAMVTILARQLDQLEEAILERLWAQLNRA